LPRATFEANILGTVSVLEAVRLREKPCVVIVITSDKCYAVDAELSPPGVPASFREVDRLGGRDPYSASKAAAECVAAAYRASYFPPEADARHGVRLATVRAGNVIGGGDWGRDRILPDVVRAVAAGKTVALRQPDAIRPWQHVLEPLHGYVCLAERLLASPLDPEHGPLCTAWNFGPLAEAEVPVRELVERFLTAMGGGSWQDAGASARDGRETTVLRLNSEKAMDALGWWPRWTLEEALARTAAWYRRHLEDPGADMRSSCMADIEAYEAAEASR
jgi:CDP-glucose 4,6-dehydratase